MDPKPGDTVTAIGQTFGPALLTAVKIGGTCWIADSTVDTEFGTVTLSEVRLYEDESHARAALAPMPADSSVLYRTPGR